MQSPVESYSVRANQPSKFDEGSVDQGFSPPVVRCELRLRNSQRRPALSLDKRSDSATMSMDLIVYDRRRRVLAVHLQCFDPERTNDPEMEIDLSN